MIEGYVSSPTAVPEDQMRKAIRQMCSILSKLGFDDTVREIQREVASVAAAVDKQEKGKKKTKPEKEKVEPAEADADIRSKRLQVGHLSS